MKNHFTEMMNKIYELYCRKIYRNYKHLRGTWRIKHMLTQIIARSIESYDKEPESVFEKDWENLLILDAARHDLYEELEGETEKRTTLAGQSTEYIEKNFSEGDFSDVVYVTANPFFSETQFNELTGRKPEEVFHEVFHTYKTDWDTEHNTVMPEELIRDAKTAKKLFPEKKIVVHFMQPHYPFVNSKFTDEGIRPDLDHEKEGFSIWELAETGKYDREELWEAYRENLELVLPKAKELAENLGGKTAITADHGNFVGEEGLYGHPRGVKSKPVREVPWHVIEHE